jgi:P4 family phage/plasmid primase-like protien
MTQQDGSVNNKVNDCEAAQMFSNPLPGNTETAMTTELKTITTFDTKHDETGATYKVAREISYNPNDVTLITTADAGRTYTKKIVFNADGTLTKHNYDNCFLHEAPESRAVATCDDIEALLRELSLRQKTCVIRGQVVAEYAGNKVRRTSKETDTKGNPQVRYFDEVPRSWAMIDVDGDGIAEVLAEQISGTLKEKLTTYAHWLVNVWLPPVFQLCDAVVQWSSSFGLDGRNHRMKAHVWFKLDGEFSGVVLRELINRHFSDEVAGDGKPYLMHNDGADNQRGMRRLDFSVLSTSHPNYTAAPLILDAAQGCVMPDPLGDLRVIRVNKGNKAVSCATLHALVEAENTVAVKKQANGQTAMVLGAKTVSKADPPAPANFDDWSAKDKADYKLAEEYLSYLDINVIADYHKHLKVGMAIHSRFPNDAGFWLWRNWASVCPNRDLGVAVGKWAGFKADVVNGRTFGALRGMAEDNGYIAPKSSKADYAVMNDDAAAPGVPGVGAPDYGDEIPMLTLTAADHARRIKAAWGSKLRYVTDWNNWCVFYNGRWTRFNLSSKEKPDGVISAMIAFSMSNLLIEGKRLSDEVRLREFRKGLEAGMKDTDARKIADKVAASVYREYKAEEKSRQEAGAQKGLLDLLGNDPDLRVQSLDWDTEPHLIGAKNGIVNLRTGELLPLTPDRLMLRWANATYKPELAGTCSVFYKFTNEVMMLQTDTEMTEEATARAIHLRKVSATFLTGEVKARQKFYIWHGTSGANGKSTYISFLNKMLRPCETSGYFLTVQAATLLSSQRAAGAPTSDLMAFQGMRLAVLPEVASQGGRLDMGFIKGVTSGDAIPGRAVYGRSQVAFDPTCKLVMACNTVPSFASDGGTARRLEVTGFERSWAAEDDPASTKPKADVNLPAKLEAEMDAIFATLVKECVELYANGFKIEVPESIRNVTTELNDDMNPVKEFIDRFCTRCDETTRASQLSDEFERWRMTRRGTRAYSPNAFSDEMKRLGIEKKVTNQGKMYVGIRVNRALLDQHCMANTSSPI